ncbi:TPA: hypothetical protein JBJ19_02365 [Legionella pneumophila]|nr:hypothetical protein [Legionella pneumophila]HAU1846792.1 hypothetical protein [Legionella pneumophila]
MKTERGIILSPEVEIDIVSNVINLVSSAPDPKLLRHAILYWDKIDFPTNNVLSVDLSPDMDFLKQEGIVQQTDIRINQSGDLATLYVQAQFNAFELLNQKDPDKWTIGQHAKNLITPPTTNFIEKQIIEIEINSLLPVPPDDIPLDDLLEFKKKRKDEFALLRISIDKLFDKALKWESLPRGRDEAINSLQTAITDIQKLVDASWLTRGSFLKWEFTLPKTVGGFVAGQKLSESTGIPGLEYIGALLGNVTIQKKFGISALPEAARNFAALYYVEQHFPGSVKITPSK